MTTMTESQTLEKLSIDTIRTLSMDAVQKANSGHPGTPMALAPVAYALYTRIMRHNPADPEWPDRDRFVLSCGHASMLLYSVLYLTGYGLTLDDLKNFRQLGSKTPGHPEYGHAPGVETTTGPLGQGISNAVGMALAERMLAARFNRAGHEIVDHHTYTIASDGDIQEGVRVRGLLARRPPRARPSDRVLRRQPHLSSTGDTALAFSEDVASATRPTAGTCSNLGEDIEPRRARGGRAARPRTSTDRPTLIVIRTHIGYGSPNKQDTRRARLAAGRGGGAADQGGLRLARDKHFYVPDEALAHFREAIDRGQGVARPSGRTASTAYEAAEPELARRAAAPLRAAACPTGWDEDVPQASTSTTAWWPRARPRAR